MELLSGAAIAITGILSVLLVRSFTTFVHEYGHAIPALLFTNEPVEVYVGSYGSIKNAWVWKIGRLTTYFTFNFFNWNMGMCQHRGGANLMQSFLITLGGPVASLLLAIPLIAIFQNEGVSDTSKFFICIFAMSAVWDFFVNIIPNNQPMIMHDGSVTYNDGHQLKVLYKAMSKPAAYLTGLNFFSEKKYEEAYAEFQKLIDQDIHDRSAYEKMAECLIAQKKYPEALDFYENILVRFKRKTQDYSTLGKLHLKLQNYDSALENLNQAIHLNQNNVEDLTNRGRVFLEFKDYREATFDLNNALRINNQYPAAYANRGLLHLRINEMEAAKWDLEKALSIDENHAFAHLYFGYFYEKNGDFTSNKKALEYFLKARELGVEERNIDWIIAEAQRSVGFS